MILGKEVTPCDGELLVRSYLCTQFNSRLFGIKADGYLEVTNKRLLFQAKGNSISGWSVIHSEVAIGDVSEIKVYKGTSFNIPVFILGIVLSVTLAVGIKAALYSMGLETIGTIIALAAFCYFVYRVYYASMKKAFSMLINTKGGSGNVVYIAGLSPFGGGNTAAARALSAEPAKDSELLIKEIGAVVLDIQQLGDYGIEKWQKQG